MDAHSPVFSPDKRYLLFLDKYGSENGDRVVLMDLETRKTRRLCKRQFHGRAGWRVARRARPLETMGQNHCRFSQ